MTFILLFCLGLLAWLVSTLAAGGGVIIFLPLASFLIPVKTLAPATSIAATISGVQRVWLYRKNINWNIIKWLMPGIIIGAIAGTYLFSQIEGRWLMLLIALFLIFNVGHRYLSNKKYSFKMRLEYFLPAGFITALLSGIVGAAGPVLNPFYLNYDVVKEEMIGTKAFSSLVMQVVKIIGYIYFAEISREVFMAGAAVGSGALCGNYIGKKVLQKISDNRFRDFVNIMLLASALLMIYKFMR